MAVYVHPTRVLHAEAIRDLIAILRVLHAAELEMPDADQAKLDKLAMVARELKEALPIVVALQPKERPYRALSAGSIGRYGSLSRPTFSTWRAAGCAASGSGAGSMTRPIAGLAM